MELKDKVIYYVTNRTERFSHEVTTPEVPLSEKGQKIKDIVNKFPCHDKQLMAELCSELLDEKISVEEGTLFHESTLVIDARGGISLVVSAGHRPVVRYADGGKETLDKATYANPSLVTNLRHWNCPGSSG